MTVAVPPLRPVVPTELIYRPSAQWMYTTHCASREIVCRTRLAPYNELVKGIVMDSGVEERMGEENGSDKRGRKEGSRLRSPHNLPPLYDVTPRA